MADATAKKKDSGLSASNVLAMSDAEREKLLLDKRGELIDSKHSHKAGELTNPRKLRNLRREIAIIRTVQNISRSQEEEG